MCGDLPEECEEVTECHKICTSLSALLEANGVECPMFFDTTSTSQSQYLAAQANWTNAQHADLGVQCHLNAGGGDGPVGCEVWYYSQETLARKVATAMANALGLPDRGPKWTSSLSWIMNSDPPCVLLECFFGDSRTDCSAYKASGAYDKLVEALAESLTGIEIDDGPVEPPIEPPERPPTELNYIEMHTAAEAGVQVLINGATIHGTYVEGQPVVDLTLKGHGDVSMQINGEMFHNAATPPVELPPVHYLLNVSGRCSWFGGPEDMGVSPSEGLAFIYEYDQAPHLFLDRQPSGTTGLARRLDTEGVYYVACRWDYDVTPKDMLARKDLKARVRAGDREFLAWPADWGPNENTGRVADISHALMEALGINTDDVVEVAYPVEVSEDVA
jgi:hypothetical protein